MVYRHMCAIPVAPSQPSSIGGLKTSDQGGGRGLPYSFGRQSMSGWSQILSRGCRYSQPGTGKGWEAAFQRATSTLRGTPWPFKGAPRVGRGKVSVPFSPGPASAQLSKFHLVVRGNTSKFFTFQMDVHYEFIAPLALECGYGHVKGET